MFEKKIGGASVVQQVIDCLTEAMLTKELKPGDKIPTEMELADSLGVGRNSIREAIKILVYLGVLEIKRAGGTFVCEGFSESMIDPMIYGIILDKGDSYDSLMELREMIEVGVMELAMKKNDPNDLKLVQEKLDNMKKECTKKAYDVKKVFNCDNEFHEAISLMAHNSLVHKINNVVRTLTYSMRMETVTVMLEKGKGPELFVAHEEIFNMLQQQKSKNLNNAITKTYFRQEIDK